MSNKVLIRHLENANITAFVDGKKVDIRNGRAEVEIETAKKMMEGPWGYELVGVYDNFVEYVNKIAIKEETLISQKGAPFFVALCTPLAGQKIYSWELFFSHLLNIKGKEKLHLVFTIDNPEANWIEMIKKDILKHKNEFAGATLIYWDSDKEMAWGRVFKITTGRQLLFNYVRKTEASHLWFVDSDNLVPDHALETLLSHKRDHVAGLYRFKAVYNGAPVVYNGKGNKTWPPTCLADNVVDIIPNSGTYEVDWTGGGCLLLSRRIFEKYNFDWNMWIQRSGEDAWICLAAQQETGNKLLVDTSVNCGHLDESGKIW